MTNDTNNLADGVSDDARAAMRRALLQTLAGGRRGDLWAEVAGGVLDGTTTLEQAFRSGAYGGLLRDALAGLQQHRDEVGRAAFDEQGRAAGEIVREMRGDRP